MKPLKILLFILILLMVSSCSDPKKVPVLTRQLSSSNASERNQAALELGYIGAPHANIAVPMLIRLLSDPNPGVQSSAAFALRKIGTPEAQTALDAARRFKR
jgi:HEAT repeat protein